MITKFRPEYRNKVTYHEKLRKSIQKTNHCRTLRGFRCATVPFDKRVSPYCMGIPPFHALGTRVALV